MGCSYRGRGYEKAVDGMVGMKRRAWTARGEGNYLRRLINSPIAASMDMTIRLAEPSERVVRQPHPLLSSPVAVPVADEPGNSLTSVDVSAAASTLASCPADPSVPASG
jgi:hypothetical protein